MTEKKVFSWLSKILFFGSIALYLLMKLLVDSDYIVIDRSGSGNVFAQVILMFVAIIMGIFAESVSRYVGAEKTKMNIFALNFFRVSFYIFAFIFIFLLFKML